MVERGSCSFLSKSIQAERAGARAVIVYDNNSNNDDSYIGSSGPNNGVSGNFLSFSLGMES